MKPSELIAFLKEHDRFLKKSLSQNFLIDENIINKIVTTAQVKENDPVLEIGPGAGSLTSALIKQKALITAVEKDTFFAEKLPRLSENLTVYNEDILTFDLNTLKKNTKVIANLPYNITTPILSHLLQHKQYFSSFTLMVQKEVAQRICAKPHTKAYGSLSVFIQYYTDPTYAFTVSGSCFIPKPKVDSAVIHLKVKETPLKDPDPFFKLVRTAFEKRRKMLTSSLDKLYPKELVYQALIDLDLNPQARPENLDLNQWIQLFKKLK